MSIGPAKPAGSVRLAPECVKARTRTAAVQARLEEIEVPSPCPLPRRGFIVGEDTISCERLQNAGEGVERESIQKAWKDRHQHSLALGVKPAPFPDLGG